MASQSSSHRTKEHSPAAWDAVRDVFTDLYQNGEHTLKEIIAIMKQQYGFDANERQWKGKIEKWSLAKNIKSSEAKFMLYKKAIREYRDGKDTVFKLNGRQIEERRLTQAEKKLRSMANSATIWSPNTLLSIHMDTPNNINYCTPHFPDDRRAISASYSSQDFYLPRTLQHYNQSNSDAHCIYCNSVIHDSKLSEHLLIIHADKLDEFDTIFCALCSDHWFGPAIDLLWMFEAHLRADHSEYQILLWYADKLAQMDNGSVLCNSNEFLTHDEDLVTKHAKILQYVERLGPTRVSQSIPGYKASKAYIKTLAVINPPAYGPLSTMPNTGSYPKLDKSMIDRISVSSGKTQKDPAGNVVFDESSPTYGTERLLFLDNSSGETSRNIDRKNPDEQADDTCVEGNSYNFNERMKPFPQVVPGIFGPPLEPLSTFPTWEIDMASHINSEASADIFEPLPSTYENSETLAHSQDDSAQNPILDTEPLFSNTSYAMYFGDLPGLDDWLRIWG